jgi:hypothetical protein
MPARNLLVGLNNRNIRTNQGSILQKPYDT